jgi:FtsH-binding integral membrane protein
MLLNLAWLKELVELITSRSSEKKARTKGLAGFFFMYLLFGLCLYVIISIRGVELVPLLLGISTLVFGTFCVSIKELISHPRE